MLVCLGTFRPTMACPRGSGPRGTLQSFHGASVSSKATRGLATAANERTRGRLLPLSRIICQEAVGAEAGPRAHKPKTLRSVDMEFELWPRRRGGRPFGSGPFLLDHGNRRAFQVLLVPFIDLPQHFGALFDLIFDTTSLGARRQPRAQPPKVSTKRCQTSRGGWNDTHTWLWWPAPSSNCLYGQLFGSSV